MTSRDGELICPQCKTLLNTSDRLCWRCGGTNLQPGPKADFVVGQVRKASGVLVDMTEDLLIDLHKQVRDNPPPPVSLKWPVDANGTPLPADPTAFCVCTPYYKCAYHAGPGPTHACGCGVGMECGKHYNERMVRSGGTAQNIGTPSHFGVDPAWVESVRKASKLATPVEIEAAKGSILRAYAILHAEMFNRAEPWDAK